MTVDDPPPTRRPGRRTFLKRAVHLTATALGMAAAVLTGHVLMRGRRPSYPTNRARYGRPGTRVIRPPSVPTADCAVEEDKFLAGCIRCCRCQDACERGAIQFFDETFGRLYHTPYVDPAIVWGEEVGCNICMKCTRVCPTGVLRPMEVEQVAEVDMATPVSRATVELDVDNCLSYKAEARYDQRAVNWEVKLEPSLEPVDLPDQLDPDLQRRGPCGECYMVCEGVAVELPPQRPEPSSGSPASSSPRWSFRSSASGVGCARRSAASWSAENRRSA